LYGQVSVTRGDLVVIASNGHLAEWPQRATATLAIALSKVDQQIGFFDFEERKIAYATVGQGPVIAFPSWWISHVELEWRDPAFRAFFATLAANHTVVRYDRLGVGLSDRRRSATEMSLASELTVFEAVLAHLRVERCSIVGLSCGGCIASAFAARHPERVTALAIYGGYARGEMLAPAQVQAALVDLVRTTWGFGSRVLVEVFMTGADAAERRAYVDFQRAATTPDVAADLLELTFALDARVDLPQVQAPTSVVHRTHDRTIPFAAGREVATLVAGARLMPLPGEAHLPWRGDGSATAAVIANGLGVGPAAPPDPALDELTTREREVLALVARGFSDAGIAEQLVLSPHTVHRHVANIRTKLNLPSRAAAAALAVRAGLG
jgi:pimeloyl-ACP methyl ester carboxylesterase/DNA-binding CsgD family transcriptional regulator